MRTINLVLIIVFSLLIISCKDRYNDPILQEENCFIFSKIDPEKGTVSSAGKYLKGDIVDVHIEIKEGYKLEGVYFSYSSPYYSPVKYPTKKENMLLPDSKIRIELLGNIEIVPVVSYKDKGSISDDKNTEYSEEKKSVEPQKELIDKDFWKEQNRLAFEEIAPKIIKVSDEEAFRIVHLNYPDLSKVLYSKRIYRNQVNYFSQFLWNYNWRDDDGRSLLETENKEKAYRIAFALADENGNIVEIYPPMYWTFRPESFTLPCFVTVPAGRYKQKVLINMPNMRGKWIDVPLTCAVSSICKDHKNPWGYPSFHQLKVPKEAWFDESWNEKIVVDESDKIYSTPVWHNLQVYRNGEEVKLSSYGIDYNIEYARNEEFELYFSLSSYCGESRKGKIVIMQENRLFVDPKNELVRRIEDNYFPQDKLIRLSSYAFKIGEGNVVCGSGERQKVKVRIADTFSVYDGYFYNPSLVFYWIEEGANKLQEINSSGHEILNQIKVSNISPKEWWFSKLYTSEHCIVYNRDYRRHSALISNKISI